MFHLSLSDRWPIQSRSLMMSNEDYQYCKDLFKSDLSLGILGRNSVMMFMNEIR